MDLITLRSRPCCSHRFRSGPVRFLGASPLGAPTTSSPTTRHLPHPHRPIEFFANNFFDCRHRGSLAASTQVNRAPRDLHPPSIFSTYAPRLERVLFNARRRRSSHQDLGSHPEQLLLVVGHHIAIDFSPPTSHVFAHAALGPRHHRRSHSSDLFFQLIILGFTSG